MMKKLFTMFLALAAVAALAAGVVACDDGEKNSGGTETDVAVAGGYAYYPPDQGGYGLELNLYEDGTFYFSQFTQTVTYGEYSAAEATGTDENGNTIFYTVTFENDPFVAAGGTATHNVVQTADGAVQLTNMYDLVSNHEYNFNKQDDFFEETPVTVAQYWSDNFAEDYVRVTFFSDDTYSLEGINGVDDENIPLAGSSGTYTSATAEDGTVTYTMTDGKDSSKVYTLTATAAGVTLTAGESEYTMTAIDPTATVAMEFTGTAIWGSITLTCYDNSSCEAVIHLIYPQEVDFPDSTGSWSYVASDDMYTIMLGGVTYSAEPSESDPNTYTFNYKVNQESFAGAEVTMSFTREVANVLTLSCTEESWGFSCTAVLTADNNFVITTVMGEFSTTEESGTWVQNEDGSYTLTFVEMAEGSSYKEDDTLQITKEGDVYSLTYTTLAGAKTLKSDDGITETK